MAARKGDMMIAERRRIENERASMQAAVSGDHHLRRVAKWENKTYDRILRNNVERQFDSMQKQESEALEVRRDRLADLLRAEQDQYQYELANMTESADVRRERMENRARALREQRESERLQEVEDRYQQRFRAMCDPLREFDSKVITLECTHARDVQLHEKAHRKKVEHLEDRVFHQLWEQNRLDKEKREKDDAERLAKLNSAVKGILDEQMEYRDNRIQTEKNEDHEEAQRLKALWRQQQLDAEEKERQNRRNMIERNHEIQAFNKLREDKMAKEAAVEKAEDIDRLNKVLAYEKLEEEAEFAWKEHQKREGLLFRKMLEEQMIKEAQDESELEALRKADQDRAWKKREDVWEAEARARNALMDEVDRTRKQQIEEKKAELRQQREERAAERERIMAHLDALKYLDTEQESQKKEALMNTQKVLLEQMELKNHIKNASREMKEQEKASLQKAEAEYQRRLK
eukprot:GFYU01008838.1.p2 GENE.GFYU01008838.1~~GFYU01008838.1.p2  ORF type:complete len:462 (-),score=178.09 GFYU01008838.1:48-1433(-)